MSICGESASSQPGLIRLVTSVRLRPPLPARPVAPVAAVDQQQSQWFQTPCSGGASPPGGTAGPGAREDEHSAFTREDAVRSRTGPLTLAQVPIFGSIARQDEHPALTREVAVRSRMDLRSTVCLCDAAVDQSGRVCGLRAHVVEVRILSAARFDVSLAPNRRQRQLAWPSIWRFCKRVGDPGLPSITILPALLRAGGERDPAHSTMFV